MKAKTAESRSMSVIDYIRTTVVPPHKPTITAEDVVKRIKSEPFPSWWQGMGHELGIIPRLGRGPQKQTQH